MNHLFAKVTAPAPNPVTARTTYRMSVRDMVVQALVGVYEHEHQRAQPIRVNLDIDVAEPLCPRADRFEDVVSYEKFVQAVRDVIAGGHINLVETLAERIAGRCLADARVRTVRVRVEKLEAFPDCASVGIEIERANP